MTLTKAKNQKFALVNALQDGKFRNKHGLTGKIKQLSKRIRTMERSVNHQNWLAQ